MPGPGSFRVLKPHGLAKAPRALRVRRAAAAHSSGGKRLEELDDDVVLVPSVLLGAKGGVAGTRVGWWTNAHGVGWWTTLTRKRCEKMLS